MQMEMPIYQLFFPAAAAMAVEMADTAVGTASLSEDTPRSTLRPTDLVDMDMVDMVVDTVDTAVVTVDTEVDMAVMAVDIPTDTALMLVMGDTVADMVTKRLIWPSTSGF